MLDEQALGGLDQAVAEIGDLGGGERSWQIRLGG
jgi:hypothetical protein